MPNARAAALIAERLPTGLLYPGNPALNQPAKLIPLPGLRNLGISPDQATQFANEAGLPSNDAPKLIAEALIHTLETDGGIELVDKSEIADLRAQLAAPQQVNPAAPMVDVCCRDCGARMFQIPVNRSLQRISSRALREHIEKTCSCGAP
jgi:hypothetical protein